MGCVQLFGHNAVEQVGSPHPAALAPSVRPCRIDVYLFSSVGVRVLLFEYSSYFIGIEYDSRDGVSKIREME